MAQAFFPMHVEFQIRELMRNPGFFRDLVTLNELSDDDLSLAVTHLLAAKGFVGSKRIARLLGQVLGVEFANALGNFVFHFASFATDGLTPGDVARKFGTELRRIFGRPNAEAPPFDLPRVTARLEVLGQSFPAVERQIKSSELARAIGQTVERAAVICDLRPVFDVTRTNIEGLVPVITLKLVLDAGADEEEEVEAVLSIEKLGELQQALEETRRKLFAMRTVKMAASVDAGELGMPEEWSDD
jgi:hypothetical protein